MFDALTSILSFFPVIAFAALGGFITQKSGVWNIAMEGIMAFGAFSGVFAYHYLGHNLWIAFACSFAFSCVHGLLLAVLSVYYALNQIVVGFGIWFFAEGLAGFLYSATLAGRRIPETLPSLFFSQDPFFFLAITGFAVLYIVFRYTTWGLVIRGVGENPQAVDTAGIDVYRVRGLCALLGSGFIGVAGAYLSLSILQGFTYTLVAGYGWAAFAIILLGRWSVPGVFLGSLFFTLLVGVQTRLQIAQLVLCPSEFIVILPHIGVILTLALAGALKQRAGMPAALGRPYVREARV